MGAEQRKETRYTVELPVDMEETSGVTRDLSTSGVFFETDKSFTPGQTIEFSINFINNSYPILLKCVGEIVRIENKGQKIGVAASISSYGVEKVEGR